MSIPRIAIIGGHGHHSVLELLKEPGSAGFVGLAADGYDSQVEKVRINRPGLADVPSFSDYREMLSELKPDIVSVGAPYALNGEIALASLEAGASVICEKPVASSWETLRQLREVTAETGRLLIAEMTMRWDPEFLQARKLMDTGRIGSPVLIQARKSYRFGAARPDFYRNRSLYGGTLLWVAIHALDFVQWVSRLDYVDFCGLQGNLSQPEYGSMEDHLALLSRMSNGADCVITADYLRPQGAPTHGDDRLHIAGTLGTLEVRAGRCFVIDSGGEEELVVPSLDVRLERAKGFLAAALGRPDSRITTRESLNLAAIALTARDAVDQGVRATMSPANLVR